MTDRLLEQAERAAEQGDFAAARLLATKARHGNPDDATTQRADQLLNKTAIDSKTRLVGAICALAALAIFLYYTLG
jgi:hypothetical protein